MALAHRTIRRIAATNLMVSSQARANNPMGLALRGISTSTPARLPDREKQGRHITLGKQCSIVCNSRALCTPFQRLMLPLAVLLDRLPHASSVKEVQHLTAYGLAVGIPLAVFTSAPISTVVDLSMGFIVPLHTHIGMRSILVDYMPHMGLNDENGQRAVLLGLGAFTVVSTAALLKFNLTDVGLSGFVRRFWMRNKAKAEAH